MREQAKQSKATLSWLRNGEILLLIDVKSIQYDSLK